MREYMTAARARRIHPNSSVRRTGVIAVIVTFSAFAADPPANIAKRVAARETETAAERSHYAYTQSVRLQELDARGAAAGEYRETREVIFSPAGDRSERFVGEPVSRLRDLILTEEDFADIRDIQPFVLTKDQLWNYDVDYKGGEPCSGDSPDLKDALCWALRIRPKQIKSGGRWFDGMIWVRQDDFSVVKSEGQAVPQIVNAKQENLFPRFVTVRKLVNGFWFPSSTTADDTLYFRNGPIREKLVIRYNDYKRFGSEVTLTFEPER